MRTATNRYGLKFLRELGFRLGLAEAGPPPIRPHSALRPHAVAPPDPAADQDSGYPFPELQESISVAEVSRALHEDMGLPAADLRNSPPPEATAPPDAGVDHEALTNLLKIVGRPAPEPTIVQEIRDNLQGLLAVLGGSEPGPAEPKPILLSRHATLYAALAGKKVTLLGLGGAEHEQARHLLERQGSLPRAMSFDPSEDPPAGAFDCSLLVLAAAPEWELVEPIDPGFLSRAEVPILVTGSRRLLTRLAQIPQSGPRDYAAIPWQEDEFAWRSAMLVSRPVAVKRQSETVIRRDKPEILIADDDVTTRTLLGSLLTRHGMICHIAENGDEALDIFKARRPCAAILDIIMPCMDGFQVLAAVKQDPNLLRTPVVLLTSRNSEVDKLQAFALGADDYLTKPFSPMELAIRLKRLLKRAS